MCVWGVGAYRAHCVFVVVVVVQLVNASVVDCAGVGVDVQMKMTVPKRMAMPLLLPTLLLRPKMSNPSKWMTMSVDVVANENEI